MSWGKGSWGGGGGQWGKGGGGGGGDQGGELWKAINDTVQTLAAVESQWDSGKLEKKLAEYFRKASSKLNFGGGDLLALINEYADNALGSVFAGLGDRDWLYNGQCDLLLVVDAGIKDTFPRRILQSVSQEDFEQIVLAAYDRAFEEQRFGPILTEAVNDHCQGPKSKKKVWNAVDMGRKEASQTDAAAAEEFMQVFLEASVRHLAEACGGYPEQSMDKDTAVNFFMAIVKGGGLPLRLQGVMPELEEGTVWPVIEEVLEGVYEAEAAPAQGPSWSSKRQKTGW